MPVYINNINQIKTYNNQKREIIKIISLINFDEFKK